MMPKGDKCDVVEPWNYDIEEPKGGFRFKTISAALLQTNKEI